jgi:hypothetical protein
LGYFSLVSKIRIFINCSVFALKKKGEEKRGHEKKGVRTQDLTPWHLPNPTLAPSRDGGFGASLTKAMAVARPIPDVPPSTQGDFPLNVFMEESCTFI